MQYVGRAIKMLDDRDPKGKLIETFETSLKPWGYTLDDDTLVGVERMQPLASKVGVRVFGPDYLIAIYERSGQYTGGKILVPDSYLEDKVQGKIGLVVGIGPLCKGPEYEDWFNGHPPQLGDWVMTSVRDGLTFIVGGIVMKLIEWKYLRLTTLDPDLVV